MTDFVSLQHYSSNEPEGEEKEEETEIMVGVRWCDSSSKLVGMMVLSTSFMIVEMVVGNLTNSMALVADSFHMLSDVIALIIAFVSVR